jgi:hypothetical protein
METRHGVNGTLQEGVFFTEASIQGATPIRHLHVEISRQNSNLSDVKVRLAKDARSIGATAIMNFRYGQKKHPWFELTFTFKWDTESWHGEGDAVKV